MAGLLENKVVACKALTRDGGAPFLLLRFQALQYRGLCAIGGQKLGMPRQIVCPMSRQRAPSFGPKGIVQTFDDGGLSIAVAAGQLGWPHGDQAWKVAGSHIARWLERDCGSCKRAPSAACRILLAQRCSMGFGRLATAWKMVQERLRIGWAMQEGGMADGMRGLGLGPVGRRHAWTKLYVYWQVACGNKVIPYIRCDHILEFYSNDHDHVLRVVVYAK